MKSQWTDPITKIDSVESTDNISSNSHRILSEMEYYMLRYIQKQASASILSSTKNR